MASARGRARGRGIAISGRRRTGNKKFNLETMNVYMSEDLLNGGGMSCGGESDGERREWWGE